MGDHKPFKDQFVDILLSISLDEFLDETLYKHQVEKIPEVFNNVDQYCGSYEFPLLEEIRAELASSIQSISEAPFAQVLSLIGSKSSKFHYAAIVNHWRNGSSDRGKDGKDPYTTKPGDILLFSSLKPETVEDLQRCTYTLAYVQNDRNLGAGGFNIVTANMMETGHQLREYNVVFLTNVTTYKRAWSALRKRKNLNIIEKVLSYNELALEKCDVCARTCNRNQDAELGSALLSKLNEAQKQAVLATLDGLGCNHKPSIQLIWGPPGTGKTQTVSVLLYILLSMKIRTLICAPTNMAIKELASRVVKLVKNSPVNAEIENAAVPSDLSDILIFGNKDNLKIGSEIEDIFLDDRVDRLVGLCWKNCIGSMIDYLEHCVQQYHVYKDNMSKQDDTLKPKSLLEFARDRFKHTAMSLRESMLTLLTHVSRKSIAVRDFQCIVKVLSLLNSFEHLLFEERLKSKELMYVFSHEGKNSASDSTDNSASLLLMRTKCLSSLRSLHSSHATHIPDITSEDTAKEFCFKKASLIFCTTSTSHKLHRVKMEPLEFLVVDEAAQVKECESFIPLQIPNLMHAVFVGDECQLPSTVTSRLSEEAGFGKSLFERLSSLGHPKHLLNMQYRMHPSISRFPNATFYANQILDASNVQHSSYEKCYLEGRMFGPYSFIDIVGGVEEADDLGRSKRNMVEVAVAVKLVQKLFKGRNAGSQEKLSIGVISPYAAQVAAIQRRLKQYEDHEMFSIKVKTVDGFQGGEEDIIIISTVRTNKDGAIGFLSSPKRANVALTRARHCLWILGNSRTLCRSDSVWEELICDAKHRQCFFKANEDGHIAKTVLDVKKQLHQLDDMLNKDSDLFKNARWKVLFSDNFRKSYESLKPLNVKKLVVNMLLRLASGWRPKKVNVDLTCKSSPYVVKQFKVEGYYIICSIDVIKEDSVYTQILKVWDILTVDGIHELMKRLDTITARYTESFTNLCNEKCFEGALEVPKSWFITEEIVRYKTLNIVTSSTSASSDVESCVETSDVSESLLLSKFYSLSTSSVNHLLTDNEGRELDLPFEVTDEERDIIIFPKSSFILGRSGTGKTTILTMKLCRTLQQYCNYSSMSEQEETKLHQLFVTVSPKLCYAVKQHVSQLQRIAISNMSGDNKTFEMDNIDEMAEFEDIPDSFIGIQQEQYPLIITFHKFVMMLDGALPNSYFERFRELRVSLESEAFSRSRSVALKAFIRKNEVTYDRFVSFYWPHFNSQMTKHLDPSRVFTEIMSHIKGGLQDGEFCGSRRSRQGYVSMSNTRVSTLNSQVREVIYDIYQDYERMKMDRREFDLADLVIDIHLRLKNEKLLGDKMDFVYIDEVQDLTMDQIALFRYVCKNVDGGFVFSGDTAQTIARGIDFRFEDIRSLFYKEFLMKSERYEIEGTREKGHISDTFNLSQNFRTHMGVLRLAQSIIDLICHYFPQSIDILAPETSLIYGERPIILEPGTDESSILSIFRNNNDACGKWIGFGAEQVVLVRDDSARTEISKYIGNQAIVLTIVECKGLEFQDVLLYNFFGSSPMSTQWRILYEFLKEKDLLDDNSLQSFPSFDQLRHNILCSELKQLYVAITRTRQRLWIYEKDEELSQPMFDYWRRLQVVQVRELNSISNQMQRASSPNEWRNQGIKLFWEKNYEMASMCFGKAGDNIWKKRSDASGLRAAAARNSNSVEARAMLTRAAEIFESIGRFDTAAECFCDLGQYERAGRIYRNMSELRKAAECYKLAGCYKIAAEVYSEGNFFSECLASCIKGKYFEMGLQFIENWKQQAPQDNGLLNRSKEMEKIGEDFLENCAKECYRGKDIDSMMKFVRAFHTMDSRRNFLKTLDCLEELLILEEESGNFTEATEIAKLIGDVLLEIDLLEKGGRYGDASCLIIAYVLCESLWTSGNQGWPLKSFPRKDELLSKATLLAKKDTGNSHALICKEAAILLSNDEATLSELMQNYISSKQLGFKMCEILSVKKLLDAHFQVDPAEYGWEHELPSDAERYSEGKLLGNQLSVQTFLHLWSQHKRNILEILERVTSRERLVSANKFGIADFILNYFGVASLETSNSYRLLNPTAAWVYMVDDNFLRKQRSVVEIDSSEFVLAARRHWERDLLSVGFRVLETLQMLQECVADRHLSAYCLTSIYEITNFFEMHPLTIKRTTYIRRLQDFMQVSMGYFGTIFPLDPRESSSKSMVVLRESAISKNLLEVVMSRIMDESDILTYGQIGRAVLIWLGSGKPRRDVYEKFLLKIGDSSAWKSFIQTAWVMESPGEKLQIALEEIYAANWREVPNYISPNCFLYLVERLLVLVPHSKGYFYTTKSCFLEWVISQGPDFNPRASSLIWEEQNYSTSTSIFDFIDRVVHELIHSIPSTVEWVHRSHIDGKFYFPVMMLRLTVIQCLLCLNSQMPFGRILELLRKISNQLPRSFCGAIRRCSRNDWAVDAIASAFKDIGDPLVVVTAVDEESSNIESMFPAEAVVINLKLFSCKQDIIETLFPATGEPTSI